MTLFSRDVDLDDLLRRCRRGDERAWGTLVAHFQNLVYSIPRRMGMTEEDSGDVFSNTFLALLKSLDRIENAKTLPKWLSVTASRECLRHKRFRARGGEQEGEERGLDEIVADEEASAEENAVISVEADLVRQGLSKLNEKCRNLLALLFLEEDVSYQDVSDRLGIPMGAIGPTRSRCLDKLRQELASEGFFE
jgi:RNA polymerase sigma factor (sigma-70 family)